MRFTRELGVGEFPAVVRNSKARAPSLALDRCVTGDFEAILNVTHGEASAVVAAMRR